MPGGLDSHDPEITRDANTGGLSPGRQDLGTWKELNTVNTPAGTKWSIHKS